MKSNTYIILPLFLFNINFANDIKMSMIFAIKKEQGQTVHRSEQIDRLRKRQKKNRKK